MLDVAKFYTTESKFGSNGHYLVTKSEMEEFMFNCMVKSGAKIEHARSLSSCLILADYRGHFSHGLNRLGKCVKFWRWICTFYTRYYFSTKSKIKVLKYSMS